MCHDASINCSLKMNFIAFNLIHGSHLIHGVPNLNVTDSCETSVGCHCHFCVSCTYLWCVQVCCFRAGWSPRGEEDSNLPSVYSENGAHCAMIVHHFRWHNYTFTVCTLAWSYIVLGQVGSWRIRNCLTGINPTLRWIRSFITGHFTSFSVYRSVSCYARSSLQCHLFNCYFYND